MKTFATTILLFCAFYSFGQHKLNASIGAGYPTLLYGELGYQFKSLELSGRVGMLKFNSRGYFNADVNLRYHFLKQANMVVSNQHYWTLALSYGEFARRQYHSCGHNTYQFDQIFSLCVGHHFELGDRFNCALELGPAFIASQYSGESKVLDYLSIAGGLKFQWEVLQSENW